MMKSGETNIEKSDKTTTNREQALSSNGGGGDERYEFDYILNYRYNHLMVNVLQSAGLESSSALKSKLQEISEVQGSLRLPLLRQFMYVFLPLSFHLGHSILIV